ncbi:hypothetical protein G6M26_34825 [Agrobacterium tumefaciens]|nr:hypothetical protein [Agrobacterium tumefaciens]NTE23727.1 hypothetical protein [Agrobacterium tumefaciens]
MLIIISACTISCKKKSVDDPTPVGNCETTYQVMFGDSSPINEKTSMNYENGQLKSINAGGLSFKIEYSADKAIVSASDVPLYQIDIVNKLATRSTDLKNKIEQRMTYDGNRNLIKIETYENNNLTDTKILTYSNGNLASLTQTYPDAPKVKRITTYSYSSELATKADNDTRHLVFGPLDFNIPLSLTGSTSRNILSGSLYTSTDENFRSDMTKVYTYTRNSSGIVNKIVEDSHTVTIGNGIQTQDEKLKQTIFIDSTCN